MIKKKKKGKEERQRKIRQKDGGRVGVKAVVNSFIRERRPFIASFTRVSFRGSLSSGMSHCYARLPARVGEREMSVTPPTIAEHS